MARLFRNVLSAVLLLVSFPLAARGDELLACLALAQRACLVDSAIAGAEQSADPEVRLLRLVALARLLVATGQSERAIL